MFKKLMLGVVFNAAFFALVMNYEPGRNYNTAPTTNKACVLDNMPNGVAQYRNKHTGRFCRR